MPLYTPVWSGRHRHLTAQIDAPSAWQRPCTAFYTQIPDTHRTLPGNSLAATAMASRHHTANLQRSSLFASSAAATPKQSRPLSKLPTHNGLQALLLNCAPLFDISCCAMRQKAPLSHILASPEWWAKPYRKPQCMPGKGQWGSPSVLLEFENQMEFSTVACGKDGNMEWV